MGAHLYYKLSDETQSKAANEYLDGSDPQERLEDLEMVQKIWFTEEGDIYGIERCEGSIKTSSLPREVTDEAIATYTELFEDLHTNSPFDVKILAKSCSLRLRTFDIDQLERLTNGGEALSGDNADRYRRMLTKVGDNPYSMDEHIESVGTEAAFEELHSAGPDDTSFDDIAALVDGSKPRANILDIFLQADTESFTTDEIVAQCDIPKKIAEDHLSSLVSRDILTVSMCDFYRLDDSPIANALRRSYDVLAGVRDSHQEIAAST
jgi:hypothetical protein